MQRIIVTTGHTYTDIDGLACVIAYHELLSKEGNISIALLRGVWNNSVPEEVNVWNLDFQKDYQASREDEFVVMDMSNVSYITESLEGKKIVELYDHHFGFEDHWRSLLGSRSHIENVGACATLIVEEWRRRLPHARFSHQSAQLLGWALISNTLNFKSTLTTARDIDAFSYIQSHLTDDPRWVSDYFRNKDISVNQNPRSAIQWDSKRAHTPHMKYDIEIAQLELWEGGLFMKKHEAILNTIAQGVKEAHWLLTVVSIKDGHNYLYTRSEALKQVLREKIGATFTGDRGTTKNLMLRKEILRELKA